LIAYVEKNREKRGSGASVWWFTSSWRSQTTGSTEGLDH
jgi:hypothetical protein